MRKYKCSNKEDFEYFMIAFHYIKNSDGMYCKAKE